MAAVGAPATWVLSNHDVPGTPPGTPAARRATGRAPGPRAALLQLALPGAAYVYYGDELGAAERDLPEEALQDPVWERSGRSERGRDGERVPMPWSGAEAAVRLQHRGEDLAADAGGLGAISPSRPSWRTPTRRCRSTGGRWSCGTSIPVRRGRAGRGSPRRPAVWPSGAGGLLCALNASDAPVPLPPGEVLLASGPLGPDRALPADTAAWLAS